MFKLLHFSPQNPKLVIFKTGTSYAPADYISCGTLKGNYLLGVYHQQEAKFSA
jgi:membrane carboxypeptidase/penicillin-binding protein PbpC